MTLLACQPLSPNDRHRRKIIRFDDEVERHMPPGAKGGSDEAEFAPDPVRFHWEERTALVDMPRYRNRDALRKFFRTQERGFFRKFFVESGAEVDDVVILEVLGTHDFRLHLKKADGSMIPGPSLPAEEKKRIKKWALRETRPDQQEFRRKIAERDGLKCAITGCAIPEVLDAAHLAPRAPGGSDDPANGMILRADLHRLFDAGLLSIDGDGSVSVCVEVADAEYRSLHGQVATTGADLSSLWARVKAIAD